MEVAPLDLDDPASVASTSEGMHAAVLTLPLEWNRSRSSAVPSIILRPPLFLDNLANPWLKAAIVRDRALPYPIPSSLRVSWLAASDLGSFAAAALRHPELAGKTFDVGGPEALGGEDLARALSEAVGQPLRYVAVPPDVFEQGLAAQFGPDVARDIAGTYHYCADHPHTELLSAVSEELKRLLPRPLLYEEQWARAVRLGSPP